MAKLFANSGDPDQMPCSSAFDLGLHCLPLPFYASLDYNGLIIMYSSLSIFYARKLKFGMLLSRPC